MQIRGQRDGGMAIHTKDDSSIHMRFMSAEITIVPSIREAIIGHPKTCT